MRLQLGVTVTATDEEADEIMHEDDSTVRLMRSELSY